MIQADRKNIKHLHRLHKKQNEAVFEYPAWVSTYFWEPDAQDQIKEFINTFIRDHGDVISVRSQHPVLQERTPIHLPFLYRHEMLFEDDAAVTLFQKLNFSWSAPSLFMSLTWSYLSNLSTSFRRAHRSYEKIQHRSVPLVHPHPYFLWENYKTFLTRVGSSWKNHDPLMLGPVWVVLTDATAVTIGIPGKQHDIGSSMYTHLIRTNQKKRFQKKHFEELGCVMARAIRSCYQQKIAFIDVSFGNYIIDATGRARLIDGELLQVFPQAVPGHYKALELVVFMDSLSYETVRDYYKTMHSHDIEAMEKYQRGLLVFFSSYLKEVGLSKEELVMAQKMSHDWSTKLSAFYFTFFFSFHQSFQMIHRYRKILKEKLETILAEEIKKL